ncbi:MAG: hypothetical protein COB15_00335 [Flavobacteriales bacterium]|nr:MAG: hypothetical protein COB15_00335 [Flavobacteriales bacterium]
MNSKNLVSVIIPAYNAAPYIVETVNSVLSQTYSNFELIIVNDGSTDTTLKQLIQLQESDKRIKVIDKVNSGVCDSRNEGIKIANGDFMTFLDADDVWDYSFLECCLSKFEEKGSIQSIYTKVELINEKSEKLNQFIFAKNISSTADVLEWKKDYVASMGCTIYRSSVIDQVGFFDSELSTAADQDFHLRVVNVAPIIALDKVLFFYRVHDNNMHQNISVMERDHLYVFKKAEQNGFLNSFWFKQQCFANLYWKLAGSWWKDGNNKSRGIYFVFKSLMAYPPVILKIMSKLIR